MYFIMFHGNGMLVCLFICFHEVVDVFSKVLLLKYGFLYLFSGIRHFAMLKLTGSGEKASGTVELFPLNGRSQSEVEPLTCDMVNNLREQLKISTDYFSMLVVGKDSDVKAWFPSPMWSLDNIYDLVDSMELRLQEEKLQKRLGISCPEDRGRGGSNTGGHYGYDDERAEETYLYHRPEE
uniref:DUF4174 domain-containing protein n=1 Tax=Acanthochromis polyacanthus TaxID=80966 RepID=A0A3Q1G5P3_9TELE